MNNEDAARFDRLEFQLAHVEHLSEQLNAMVIAQGRELDRMRKLLQQQGLVLETIELERIKDTNPKPPHYQ